MVIPSEVEEKIRYLIRKFPHTEWSGVLFYAREGSFEEGNLVLTCKDILPMDLGTSGWTEFNMTGDIPAYMAENVELFDCETGILHSHHELTAFFSGQDLKTLQEEGNKTNCFVSLIVDTRGTYVAAITRKVRQKSLVTIEKVGKSYEFFGDGEIAMDDASQTPSEVITKTVSKDIIEYFNLDIERHEVQNPLEYLDKRFEEIDRKKKEESSQTKYYPKGGSWYDDYDMMNMDFNTYLKSFNNKKEEPKQLSLWEDKEIKEVKDYEKKESDFSGRKPNEKLIYKAVSRMIVCSLTLNTDKFDLKQWVSRHMTKTYGKIFKLDEKAFNNWLDFIVEHTVENYDDPSIKDIEEENPDLWYTMVANAMMEVLEPYVKKNQFISSYYAALDGYILI